MYSTRRPSGGWSRVSSGTDYGNVVSNYAVALQQAIQAQSQTELEAKIFNYKNGLLSYSDLKKFLNDRLATELPGSQRELDMRQLLVEVDDFENTKNGDIERAKLEAKYSKGGISAAEQVQIETEMLKYYKQGTPKYSEQMSVIAQAKELQRQEAKNEKIAELEGKLSEGGLSTAEQIQVMEQARSLSEKGSKEYSEYTSKIGLLKEQKREEDNMRKRNEMVSNMLDQFAPGGLTDDELLQINRAEQQFAEKGSEEYIKLKEAEAEILGSINSSGSGRGRKELEERSTTSYITNANQLQSLQDKYDRGEITTAEYLQAKGSILGLMEEDMTYGDFNPGDQADLTQRLNEYLEQKNLIESGNGVVVNNGGNRIVVDKSRLGTLEGTQRGMAYFEGEEGMEGKGEEVSVVRAIDPETGLEKDYFINENNELEEASFKETASGDVVVVRTGNIMKAGGGQKGTPQGGAPVVRRSVDAPKVGPITAPKTALSGAASRVSGMQKSSGLTKSKSESKSKSSSSASKTLSNSYNAVKKATTTGTSYSTAKPIVKIGKVKVTKGNIKGTVDFGVTEKVSKTAKKVTSKIKSLFSRR